MQPPSAHARALVGTGHRIIPCLDLRQSSNKIIQKGLAFGRDTSGTVESSGRPARSEILPRRPAGRGGASVVAARMPPCTGWRISMSKSVKSKSAKQRTKSVTASPVAEAKLASQSAITAKSTKTDPSSKQSRVIVMLQSPAGATIAAMMRDDGVAATLGPWLPLRRGAEAPQAEARLKEGRRQPDLSDRRWKRRREAWRS